MADALPTPTSCCTTCGDQTNVLVPGPQGPAGSDGSDGSNGVSAFTTVNQSGGFVMPATNGSVTVTVVASAAFTSGQYVFVQNAGYLKVTAKPSSTSVTLLNENYPVNVPAGSTVADGSQISPAGIKGLDGGVDFSTLTTDDFVMPKVNTGITTASRERTSNVATITTGGAHGLATNDYVQITGLGGTGYNTSLVQVTVTGATTFTYANTGGDEGSTADTGGTVKPNVEIEVTSSLGFIAGQNVFIQDAGYFYIQSVPDSTHLIIQNNGTTGNEAAGVTIASGVRVSVYLTLNSMSPTTTKGDILVDNGANDPLANLTNMNAGTDGQVLVSDSAQANGRANTTILPNSATDNAIPRFNGTTGKPVPLQTSSVLITDDGAIQASGTGGNARGQYAVDLQVVRANATEVASQPYATIAGGRNNTASASFAAVAGGTGNTSSATYASIGGGNTNTASGNGAHVGGGISNSASSTQATVAGGDTNVASGDESTVSGGGRNQATGQLSNIAGGDTNTASGPGAAIGGGSTNTASGQLATIPGGSVNTASGNYSHASGTRAGATHYGEHAHASGYFGTANGDAQCCHFVSRRSTSDATPAELFLDGSSATLTLPNDTTWAFEIYIAARRTDADDESAAYLLQGCIDRNGSAATTALVGSVTKTVIAEDTAAWDVAATANTANGYLAITVTGEAAKTIRWVASIKVVQVTG